MRGSSTSRRTTAASPGPARQDHAQLREPLQRAGQDPEQIGLGERHRRQRGEDALLRRRVAAEDVPKRGLEVEMVEHREAGFARASPTAGRSACRERPAGRDSDGNGVSCTHARLPVASRCDFLDREIDVVERHLVGGQQPRRVERGEVGHRRRCSPGKHFLPVAAHQRGRADLAPPTSGKITSASTPSRSIALSLPSGSKWPGSLRRFRVDEVLELEVRLAAAQHLASKSPASSMASSQPGASLAQAGLDPLVGEVHVRIGGNKTLGDRSDTGHGESSCLRKMACAILPNCVCEASRGPWIRGPRVPPDCPRPRRRGQLEYR